MGGSPGFGHHLPNETSHNSQLMEIKRILVFQANICVAVTLTLFISDADTRVIWGGRSSLSRSCQMKNKTKANSKYYLCLSHTHSRHQRLREANIYDYINLIFLTSSPIKTTFSPRITYRPKGMSQHRSPTTIRSHAPSRTAFAVHMKITFLNNSVRQNK